MSSIKRRRVVLVTGANRGIGFELVKKLVEPSTNDEIFILLACRDVKRGEEALTRLKSSSNIRLIELDVSSIESIDRVRQTIIEQYDGKLDFLINNAAIGELDLTKETARKMFLTNFYGIQHLNEHLNSLICEKGRIINVASESGSIVLSEMTKDLQEKFIDPNLTKTKLNQLVEDFISNVENDNFRRLGYQSKSSYLLYSVTKAAVLALTQIEARDYGTNLQRLVLAVCPGFCDTELNRNAPGSRPASLGADSILYVINTPAAELVNGGFYLDGQLLPMISTKNSFSSYMFH